MSFENQNISGAELPATPLQAQELRGLVDYITTVQSPFEEPIDYTGSTGPFPEITMAGHLPLESTESANIKNVSKPLYELHIRNLSMRK